MQIDQSVNFSHFGDCVRWYFFMGSRRGGGKVKMFGSRGTRSLLFGVHQFIWHPITVWLAWKELYGTPSWTETVCIALHDIGYWGMKNMDGDEGLKHPEAGAEWVGRMFGDEYRQLVLGHSRSYAQTRKISPSKLCWADKLSIKYELWWLYLPRAWVSGELQEYRVVADRKGFINIKNSHRRWFNKIKEQMINQAKKEVEKVNVQGISQFTIVRFNLSTRN
ncbi:conserved hypothetical protein [Candidatus Desulfosporosinus infrequens]|uniref:HD domain-containing protein n=1 Tax=Candidatus Desulfosporosinus infrequens TaxID=2043169 RepID=A0A2U3K8B8_9FIRM|nr:conserved hypothetical protein [Candidatus Desulfosporosinus infrequens]